MATVRSGNVVGGGDWGADRLVPDCLRMFEQGKAVPLRYPQAVRPWQHVLEPLSGYLLLGERLLGSSAADYSIAWNFGPESNGDATVEEVAGTVARLWGTDACVQADPVARHPHEAGILRLDATRAHERLGWQPRWFLEQALQVTVDWQRAWLAGQDMLAFSISQIHEYQHGHAT